MSNGIIKSSVLLVVAGACAVCALLLWVVGGGWWVSGHTVLYGKYVCVVGRVAK